MGYTSKTVTGVWAGNNNNKPMTQSASIVSAPIWQQYMAAVTASEDNVAFARPAGIKEVELDADTGKAPNDATKKRRKDLFPSWYKPIPAPALSAGKINKLDGKLATECTPADALQDVTANAISAEIPSTDSAFARWQPPVAALAQSLGLTAGGNLPTEASTMHNCSDAKPFVSITATPSNGSTFTVSASVISGLHTAQKLIYYVNDQENTSQQISGSGVFPLDITPGITGPIRIQVKVLDDYLYSGTSNSVNVTGISGEVTINCTPNSSRCPVTGPNILAINWTRKHNPQPILGVDASSPYEVTGYSAGDLITVVVTRLGAGQITQVYP